MFTLSAYIAHTMNIARKPEALPGTLLLRSLRDRRGHRIVPARLAKALGINGADLARLARVHRNTLARNPFSPLVQARLGEIVAVLARAADIVGDIDRALIWFRHLPLEGFGGETAAELVARGHAAAVSFHLGALEHGAYA